MKELNEENDYWYLIRTTIDTELRKALRTNLTVAKIIESMITK